MNDCEGALHPAAAEGIRLFNRGEYFEAHEALEAAWRAEAGPVRDLYRGILQIAVTYLHVTRNNYAGAIKVYGRSQKWLRAWPDSCRGVEVGRLKHDAEQVLVEVQRLGPERLASFDRSFFKPILFDHACSWFSPTPPRSQPRLRQRKAAAKAPLRLRPVWHWHV